MQVLSQVTGRPLDTITLRDLAVHCVIGVHPEEKIRPQLLKIDLRLYLDTAPAALSGILSRTVDYSLVAKQVAFILMHSRFRLLESAAEALAVFLLTPAPGEQALIQAVDIEIRKPEALGGLSEPAVRIFRDKQDRTLDVAGTSPILFQVPEAVLERWTVDPRSEVVTSIGFDGLAILTESTGFTVLGKSLPAGSALPYGERLTIHNPSDETKTLIAVTFRGRDRHTLESTRLH